MTETEYRRVVARERAAGRAFVDAQLDRMCVDLGYPPEQWRRWRQVDRLKRANEGLRDIRVAMAAYAAEVAKSILPFARLMSELGLLPVVPERDPQLWEGDQA